MTAPVAGVAHADTGLGTSRDCNFHNAPAAGCVIVYKGYQDGRLYIQALHYGPDYVEAKVYRNGRFLKTIPNVDDATAWIRYRNGRYVLKVRFETGDEVSRIVKRFRITNA